MPQIKTLLPHQEKFINFSQLECFNRKGFLLFHFMGTGKTITSLSWAMNYPDHNIFVICPKGLENVWISEKKKIGIDNRKLQIVDWKTFFNNSEKYESKIKNSLLVMDESHHILFYFKKNKNLRNMEKILDVLNKSYKTLSLSGTPIMHSIIDLSFLMNSIKNYGDKFPLNKENFYQKYGKIKKKEANWFRYLMAKHNNPFYGISQLIRTLGITAIGVKGIIEYLKYKMKKQDPESMRKKLAWRIERAKKDGKNNNEALKQAQKELEASFFKELLPIIAVMYFVPILINMFLDARETSQKKLLSDTLNVDEFCLSQFYDLDHKKLTNEISSHVSYYDFANKSEKISDYPSKKLNLYYFKYSFLQNSILLQLLSGNLTDKSIEMLQLSKTGRTELYRDIGSKFEEYLRVGRFIANLSKFNEYLSFHKNIKIKKDLKNGFSSTHDFSQIINLSNYSILPEKFQFIINNICKGGEKEKTVIYSNFEKQGYEIMSLILNILGLKHFIVDPEQKIENRIKIIEEFNKGKVNTIILHPSIYEGISLLKVRKLYILEPIELYTIREQLIARCVRYKSHHDLPSDQRNVEIYDFSYRQARLIHGKRSIFKDELDKLYDNLYENYPDLKNKLKKPNFKINFSYIMKKKKIDNKGNKKNNLDKILIKLVSFLPQGESTRKDSLEKVSTYDDYFFEAGEDKKLIKYSRELLGSKKGRTELFYGYDYLYGPQKHRRKLLTEPDDHALFKSEVNRCHISVVLGLLKNQQNKDDKDCLKRNCKIWLPTNPGDCNKLN